jgi:hypothetical protein
MDRLDEVLAQVLPEPEPEPPPATVEEPAAQAAGRRTPGDDIELEVIETEEVTLVSHSTSREDDAVVIYTESGPTEDAPRAEREAVRPAPVEAPRFTPKTGDIIRPRERERPGARTIRFPQPAPEQAAPPSGVDEMTFLKSVTLDGPGQPRAATGEGKGTLKGAGRGTSTAAKTLKCTECGAMNRPTEWYCERCGAELAAL